MTTPRRSQTPLRLTHRIDRAERALDEFTKSIVYAQEECPTVHRLGLASLPNQNDVEQILEDLHEIISQGYGRHQHLNLENASYHTGFHISNVRDRLTTQVALDLRFSAQPEKRGKKSFRPQARRLVHTFLTKIPALIRHLEQDVKAAFDNDPAARSLELILSAYPGPKAIRTYRIAHELHKLGIAIIPRMMAEHAHAKWGIDIHPGATIGDRFFIDHGTGVVIGETTEIGNDVVLFQGVTIGARKFPRDEHGRISHNAKKRHPTIGNRVVIYANATILGGDTIIGDDAVIGSSTWITESVAPGMIVTIEEPKQRYAPNRLLAKPQVEEAETIQRDDAYWFQLYYDNITRSDDH